MGETPEIQLCCFCGLSQSLNLNTCYHQFVT